MGRPEGLDYVGLHHIGFWVESLDEAEGRLKAHGVPLFVDRPPAERGGGAFFEIKVKDPNGVIVDLNNGGWVGAKP
ncbi:MAG: hypothetical protein HYV08_04535 [Deltaproteobacteria bacterium]|nr:hypothetical protein [Deltaproteobacteria bacterium]